MALTSLIDGDIVIYRACAACEREVRWSDNNHVLTANSEEAWDIIQGSIKRIKEQTKADRIAIALSGSQNFRKSLTPTYKANRKNTRKPLTYSHMKQKLIDAYECRIVDCLEADDLLGIWQTGGKLGDTIIVSADKDLRTIPGKHAVMQMKGGEPLELIEVSEAEADYKWLTQVLTGDTADGYQGLPGCGPKTAEKILGGPENLGADITNLWGRVVDAYEAKGLGSDDALLQARLARILRASDWDSATKQPILWRP
jgi:DNA polymerase-1